MTVVIAVVLFGGALVASGRAASKLVSSADDAERELPAGGAEPLAYACVAVGLATVGASIVSSGDLTVAGVGPFLFAVLTVCTPLVISWRNRNRKEHADAAG